MITIFIKAEGQEREIDILLGNILESVSDENIDIEELTSVFTKLLITPLDLNLATKDDLNSLLILNDFQVESLLDYRKVYGRFYSIYELQYIDGFDKSVLDLLKPFITAGSSLAGDPFSLNALISDTKHEFTFRSKRVLSKQQGYSPITAAQLEDKPESRYLSGPQYLLFQYQSSYNDKFSMNLTAENDSGEPLIFKNGKVGPDFFSFSLEYKGNKHIEKLILGDFSAGFGQGLVFWSSFNSVSFQTDPLKIKMSEQSFKPYKSSGEFGFLRGCAITFSYGKFRISTALSFRKLDAKISGNEFSTIYETGEHNTFSRVYNKNTLSEGIGLTNISYNSDKFKVGFSLAAYGYDKKNGKSYSDYNIFQKYDGIFGNAGFDFVYILNGTRLFGEAAIDKNYNPAVLSGVIGYITSDISYGVMARYYSEGYNAPHSSPYSQNTRPNNEKGIKFTFSHRNILKWRFFSSLDYTYFSGPKYRVSSPSYEIDGKIELSNNIYEKVSKSLKMRYSRGFYDLKRENDKPILQGHNKFSVKYNLRYNITEKFTFTNRVELNMYMLDKERINYGYMMFQDIKYSGRGDLLTCSLRAAYFNSLNWDNRIYVSESDISSLYSSLCYGNGIKYYLLVNYKFWRRATVRFKYSLLNYFDRKKIGEGLTLIESPSKHEVKIQITFRL